MKNIDQRLLATVPEAFRVARLSLPHKIVIIASWKDENSNEITVQDFLRDGVSFIPVFTDVTQFEQQAMGSGFEKDGVEIDTNVFLSMMRGGETLIVNPGGGSPVELQLPAN